jgi:dynein heavy chain
MMVGLQRLLRDTIKGFRGKKEKWVKDWQGSLCITCGAINWTSDCHGALVHVTGGDKGALKKVKKKQVSATKTQTCNFFDIIAIQQYCAD